MPKVVSVFFKAKEKMHFYDWNMRQPFLQEMMCRVLENHRQKELGGKCGRSFHFIDEETGAL